MKGKIVSKSGILNKKTKKNQEIFGYYCPAFEKETVKELFLQQEIENM